MTLKTTHKADGIGSKQSNKEQAGKRTGHRNVEVDRAAKKNELTLPAALRNNLHNTVSEKGIRKVIRTLLMKIRVCVNV